MNEEKKNENAWEEILAKLRDKHGPEVIKLIQKEVPPLTEEMGQLLHRSIELSRESEQLLTELNALHVGINKRVQVSFSAVLGGALLVWVFLPDRIRWIFFFVVAGILIGALVILIRWFRDRRLLRDQEVESERLIEVVQHDRDKIESGYATMKKILDYIAEKEVSR